MLSNPKLILVCNYSKFMKLFNFSHILASKDSVERRSYIVAICKNLLVERT